MLPIPDVWEGDIFYLWKNVGSFLNNLVTLYLETDARGRNWGCFKQAGHVNLSTNPARGFSKSEIIWKTISKVPPLHYINVLQITVQKLLHYAHYLFWISHRKNNFLEWKIKPVILQGI